MTAEKTIDFNFTQEDYEKYLNGKRDYVSNSRIRPENETFFDAMMSVDMTATQEGRDILNAIERLN